jgi:hypothetical protein
MGKRKVLCRILGFSTPSMSKAHGASPLTKARRRSNG